MAKKPKPKAPVVAIRLAPELKKAADKAAKDDQRTFTSLVVKLLVDHLKAKGYIK